MGDPYWWRGAPPPADDELSADLGTEWWREAGLLVTGEHRGTLANPAPYQGSLRPHFLLRAHVSDVEVRLDDAHLRVGWSELDRVRFSQRVRPVLHSDGVAAQGDLGPSSIYRDCVFERVRFNNLSGFSLGRSRYERCTFVDCRWQGAFTYDAELVDCTFVGTMEGAVWGGHGTDAAGEPLAANEIRGNDFTAVRFGRNVGWRNAFPLAEQRWPEGYVPEPER